MRRKGRIDGRMNAIIIIIAAIVVLIIVEMVVLVLCRAARMGDDIAKRLRDSKPDKPRQ